jgi:predicted DNA-binding protein
LEKTTDKTKDYYVQEALIRYLEDLEDLQIGLKVLKSKSRTYTSEEADKRLKEL